ncbi:MAG TPA: peptidoglycan-binding domain-containing protein [Alphaproteobacteria bacterium]
MRYWRVLVIGAGALLAGCAASGGEAGGPGSRPPASGQAAAPIRPIQAALAQQGYDPGPVDGSYGAKTAAAIRRYQQDHKLQIDGQPSPELLASLQRKPEPVGAPALSGSSQSSQGSGLADLVNQGLQKLDQAVQKVDQGLHKEFDEGVQKVDQRVQKSPGNAGPIASGDGGADRSAGNEPGAGSDPCPRDAHKGGGVSVECSIRKHRNQEHPGDASSGVTSSGVTQSAVAVPRPGQSSTGGSHTISTEGDLAALAARAHPGEKWGYVQLSTISDDELKDENCCTVKVANSVADGSQIEVPVSSGAFNGAKHDFIKAVRGYVRRGQGQNGADVFEATGLYHQGNPHLSSPWAQTAGWLSIHQMVALIH